MLGRVTEARSEAGRLALFRAPPDLAVALGLVVVVLLTRLPFLAQTFYADDAVRFGLGLDHYDIRIDQPHAPGYPLYLLLAAGFRFVWRDPQAALVAESVLFSVASVMALYLFGRTLLGRRGGLLAAGLLLTSPAFWLYGGVALSYVTENFWGIVTAAAARRARAGHAGALLATSVSLGLAGSFRPQLVFLLGPLWLYAAWGCSWRGRLLGLGMLGATCLAWFVPTVALGGGLSGYLADTSKSGTVVFIFSPGNVSRSSLKVALSALWAAGLFLPAAVWGIWSWARGRSPLARGEGWLLLLWLLPSLLFYSLIYFNKVAYLFTFLPALALWAAAAFEGWWRTGAVASRWLSVLAVAVLAGGVTLFLTHPLYYDTPLLRPVMDSLDAYPAAYQDARVRAYIALVRQYDPADTLVVTLDTPENPWRQQWIGYMYAYYYLPEYETQALFFFRDPPVVADVCNGCDSVGRQRPFRPGERPWQTVREDPRTVLFLAPRDDPRLEQLFGAARLATADPRFPAYVRPGQR